MNVWNFKIMDDWHIFDDNSVVRSKFRMDISIRFASILLPTVLLQQDGS